MTSKSVYAAILLSRLDVILLIYSIFVLNWWLCSFKFAISFHVYPSLVLFWWSIISFIVLIMTVLLSSNFFKSSSLSFCKIETLSSTKRTFSKHRGIFSRFIFRQRIGVSLRRFLATSETKSQSWPLCVVLAHIVQINFLQVLQKQESSSCWWSLHVFIASCALYKLVAILIVYLFILPVIENYTIDNSIFKISVKATQVDF